MAHRRHQKERISEKSPASTKWGNGCPRSPQLLFESSRDTHLVLVPFRSDSAEIYLPHASNTALSQVASCRLSYGEFTCFFGALSQLQPGLNPVWCRAVRR